MHGEPSLIRRKISELHSLAYDGDPRDFRNLADEIQDDFRGSHFGTEHNDLWSSYQSAWDTFKNQRLKQRGQSHSQCSILQTKLYETLGYAKAASTKREIDNAKSWLSEAQRTRKNGTRLVKDDFTTILSLEDEVWSCINRAVERVQSYERDTARQAWAEALNAFELDRQDAWNTYKESQSTINSCWLSQVEWKAIQRDMQELFQRFQVRRESKTRAWIDKQEVALSNFEEKIRKQKDFADRQRQHAAKCSNQAYSARSSEHAALMSQFADDHEDKAAEAEENIRRLEEICDDIRRKLREAY